MLKIAMSEFQINITRKKVKFLRMRLDSNGIFQVSAPNRCSNIKIEEFILANSDWMQKTLDKYKMRQNLTSLISENDFKNEAHKLFAYWQDKMELNAEHVRFRSMKTRWGVCNVQTKIITINLELAKYPMICLEYVIVHELSHLKYKGHNRDFWQFVKKFLPDYKTTRKMLKL